jgi:hypothetical protein
MYLEFINLFINSLLLNINKKKIPLQFGPKMHAKPTTVLLIPCVKPCDSKLVILDSNVIEAKTIKGNEKIFPKTGIINRA